MSVPRRTVPTRRDVALALDLLATDDRCVVGPLPGPAVTLLTRPRTAPRRQSERTDVLTPLLAWLRVLATQVPGLCARRITTTGRPLPGGGWADNPMRGIEDVQVLVPPHGRLWAIECKAAHGRQSDAQTRRQAEVEAAGGVYTLARSVAEAQQTWEGFAR